MALGSQRFRGDTLSSMNHCIARIFSVALSAWLFVASTSAPASADAPIRAVYEGQTIVFTHVASSHGALGVGVNDPGFQALLHDTGALLTWKPGERYVLITTSAPVVVSFALGDRRYDIGPIALQAGFAPYERGDEAFLPFNEVLRALDLSLRQDGKAAVLQPQLSTLDVRQDQNGVTLFAHGGAPLHPRVTQQSASSVTYVFDGVGTTLSGTRQIGAGAVRSVVISNGGTVRAPATQPTVELAPGASAAPPRNTADHDVLLVFGGNASQSVAATGSPTPEPEVQSGGVPGSGGPASVTGVSVGASGDGASVTIAVSGDASFEWHRLREPDNRFWIDFKNAQLQRAPIDQSASRPINSVRARQ